MALQLVNSHLFAYPHFPREPAAASYGSIALTAANTTQKLAITGFFHHKSGTAKNVNQIGFLAGAVTFNVASVLTVSIQNAGTTNGPLVPSETILQSYTLTGVALTQNVWNTGTLGAVQSVTPGSLISVVFEISTFNVSDSVAFQHLANNTTVEYQMPGMSKKNTTWTTQQLTPVMVLGCDDGSFGNILGCTPVQSASSVAFNSVSASKEYALQFQVPFKCKVKGCWIEMWPTTAATGTGNLTLYDASNNALAQITLGTGNAAQWQRVSDRHGFYLFSTPQTLSPNTNYWLALGVTSATNLNMSYRTVNASGYWQAEDGTDNLYLASRATVGSGAWSTTTTQRPAAGLIIDSLDDGVSSGGTVTVLGGGGSIAFNGLNRF